MNIPENAKYIQQEVERIPNIDEWWCARCDAHGNHLNVDCVSNMFSDAVEYCCGECFEFGIWVTFVNEKNI